MDGSRAGIEAPALGGAARPDLPRGALPVPGLPSPVHGHHAHPMHGTKLDLRIWICAMFLVLTRASPRS